MTVPIDLGTLATSVAALGTASFALVDSTKIGRQGGISNSGFASIEVAVSHFFPGATRTSNSASNPEGRTLLDLLHGNWINGVPLTDQKAIAKSLIKIRLRDDTAQVFAKATRVDEAILKSVARKMNAGESLVQAEVNVLGRFDVALTSILDEGYQRADQRYRNNAKALAGLFAIILAIVGGFTLTESQSWPEFLASGALFRSVACGILAIPLAPVGKDLASALSAGVKVAQAIKR